MEGYWTYEVVDWSTGETVGVFDDKSEAVSKRNDLLDLGRDVEILTIDEVGQPVWL